MILNSPYISGSLTVTGNITACGGVTISGSIASASYAVNTSYLNGSGSGEFVPTGSFNAFSSSILTYTASNNTNIGNIHSTTASLNTASGSAITRLSSLESKTGSYATTGSNIFDGGQYLSSSFNPTGFSTTASLYTDGGLRVTKDAYISGTLYLNNVTVFGTQSVAYITSSQLNISTNLISVNTDTPSVRFGGLSVYDSGSTGLTGSILWDSENNKWIYSNPSGSSYSGGMFISGPRAASLGSETGTTSCMLLAGQGGDHLTSSMIYHDSTVTCIPTAIIGGSSITATGLSLSSASTPVLQITDTTNSKSLLLGVDDNNTFIRSSTATPLLLQVNGGDTALTINSTSIATFTSRVCTSGLSTDASLVMNCGAPISFSGTCGYIYMYSRRAGGSCGALLYANGTGQNLWFGEVGANVYGLGTGGTGTDYSGTPLLNLDVLNQRVGVGTSGPLGALHICLPTALVYIQSTTGGANAETRFISSYRTWGVGTNIGLGNCQFEVYDVTAGVNRFFIDANGVACFNGTVCSQLFAKQFAADGKAICIKGSYTGNPTIFEVGQNGSDGYLAIRDAIGTTTYLQSYSAGSSYFSGKLGIGCTTPSTPLYVVGEITSQNGEMYFKRSSFSDYGHIYMGSDQNFYIRQTAACSMIFHTGNVEKMRINSSNSIVGYSQFYSTYTKAVCTPNGGSQTVRFIEDSLGQWILVGRFVANAAIAIQSTWSSVRGLSTSLAQDEPTAFSADWGGACPTEVRIMGATDFCRWRETRTVDFIYKNIPGRPWCTFFNGGNTDGTYQTTGTIRYGYNTCGTYDGFGRWTNPFNCMIGMSDGAYCNPSSAYTTPTANAFYWNTTTDAKLTAISYTEYSGQDVNETTGFGVDDAIRGFFDSYPNLTSNMATGDVFNSAAWILLKFS